MDKLIIEGGHKLSGNVETGGSKNTSLALMSASLLASEGQTKIHRTPDLRDTHTLLAIFNTLGVKTKFRKNTVTIDSENINTFETSYDMVKKMRASIYTLGCLLGRFGEAKVSLPGGCAFGPRPINIHLESMKKLGANIELEGGYIVAKAKRQKRLSGGKIVFDLTSVGATANVLMASVLAKGSSYIAGAALEPDIVSLCHFLVSMGAKINHIGTSNLEIEGVDRLEATETNNIGDRIEAGTILVAAAITGGNINIKNIDPKHLKAVLEKLKSAGCKVSVTDNSISLSSPDSLRSTNITAKPFPGFPTDMQAQWTALMTQAKGKKVSKITDTVYFERFKHVAELNRLGAEIEIKNNQALVKGERRLKGATIMSTDLRASASLVIAGLMASGKTEVLRVYHIDRGYESIEKKLRSLGANIKRKKYQEF